LIEMRICFENNREKTICRHVVSVNTENNTFDDDDDYESWFL